MCSSLLLQSRHILRLVMAQEERKLYFALMCVCGCEPIKDARAKRFMIMKVLNQCI